jgi:type II secretory ATPase GspE/PulE/Tfp pilus assembly ATPase PilB-like protein
MVFTTLHANDTITAVGRLLDLGVQPFNLGSSLSGVLGQRLVRVLCPKCKVAYKPAAEVLQKLKLRPEKAAKFYRPPETDEWDTDRQGEPVPCDHCRGTGYFGRTGVFELLVVADEVRDLIKASPDLGAIKRKAIELGWTSLFEDGLRKVLEGRTSLSELQRVAK